MIRIIESLREDHRNIEELLLVLEHELGAFDREEEPNYEIIKAIISTRVQKPTDARCLIFANLRRRKWLGLLGVAGLSVMHQTEAVA
jgi:hypothetical protein